MSVLVVGVSHRTAPMSLLEQLAIDAAGAEKLLLAVQGCEHVLEATVLATCNRVEIYADVARFHGSVDVVSRLLCELADASAEDVVPHLYVHYDDGAIVHLFQVAAGLDSMVLGEGQILGQVREALRRGQEAGAIGPSLNSLFQQALRVGKRSHAETGIDRATPSLVSVALDRAVAHIGPLEGRRAVVLGAGAMARLAVSTLTRADVADLVVLNRSDARATRIAQDHRVRAGGLDALPAELSRADLLVSCTASYAPVVSAADVVRARGATSRPLAVVDLALPHDVDPRVAELPGLSLIGLARLAEEVGEGEGASDLAAVREIVSMEAAAFLGARRAASVTPTVVALRTMATAVVDAELDRLQHRLPDLDPQVRAEVETAVRRVADKLMHAPSVRVRELAAEDGGVSYAAALAELFSLDPLAVEAVTRPLEGVRP